MKLTKFQHACFVVEKDGSTIVVDPGAFSHDFIVPHHVDAIVITHEHADHLDEHHIQDILEAHPKATVIAHESIAGRYTNFATIAAKIGEPLTVGTFTLRFFGGLHASIADTIPVPPNLSILIDDRLYYPGDSFTIPEGVAVKELALPASAPWLKISEAMNFLATIKPEFTFPTHDGILSDDGKQLVDRILGAVASGQNTVYKRLDGQTVELA
jgi:L-ascorbate metabolism protein UlaG (beta-lactamase superfamily)